jgi:hypothetical protein
MHSLGALVMMIFACPLVVGEGAHWDAYVDGQRIGQAEFFEIVGRPDLVRDLGQRQRTRTVMIGVGLGGVGVGSLVMVTDLLLTPALYGVANALTACPAWGPAIGEDCPSQSHSDMLYVGAGLAAAGALVAVIGAMTDATPISADEARRLAGLRGARVQPVIAPGGGGLVWSWRF